MRKRKQSDIRKAKYATRINSFVRMLLVRNRTVPERLAGAKATHIKRLLYQLRGVLKSGQAAIRDWLEIWNVAATSVQKSCIKWLRRRKFLKFFRGMQGMRRMARGQLCRQHLRRLIYSLQV